MKFEKKYVPGTCQSASCLSRCEKAPGTSKGDNVMKMRKGLYTILMSFLLALWLAACGAAGQEPGVTPEGSPDTPTATSPALQEVDENGQSVEPESVDLGEIDEDNIQDANGESNQVMPAPGVPDLLPQLTVAVSADLAAELGVAIDQIEVESASAVIWADSSLGCPEADTMYAQVLTPGYRLVLTAGAQTYYYHADAIGEFFQCDAERAVEPVSAEE
jgi:hypothetical protein